MGLLRQYWTFMSQYDVPHAFWINISLTLLAGGLALILGTLATAMRISPVPSLRGLSTFYVNAFRDIPLTVVMVAMSTVLWLNLDVQFSDNLADNFYVLAVIGLGLYHSSFIAEALRSGVNTVPVGQAEAARSIG
ncbi:MAG: ABC transporter permease subunit, partial [Propionibacteriaceae bacterium]|nr:ABC transporter permease subunit [Propionibacteriaceae bacterium]